MIHVFSILLERCINAGICRRPAVSLAVTENCNYSTHYSNITLKDGFLSKSPGIVSSLYT